MRREFRVLWRGVASSNLADGMVLAITPLIATRLTSDPILVASSYATRFAAVAIGGIVLGPWLDAQAADRVMRAAALSRTVLFGMFGLALFTGHATITALILLQAVAGLLEVAFDSSFLAATPRTVERGSLEAANGRLQSTQTLLNEFIGPLLVGAVVAAKALLGYFFISVVYLFTFFSLKSLRLPKTNSPAGSPHPKQWFGGIVEGLRYINGHPVLRLVVGSSLAMNFAFGAFGATYVLYALQEAHLSPSLYSVILTASPIGVLLGLVALKRAHGVQPAGARLSLSAAVIGSSTLLIVLIPNFVGLFLAGIVGGLGIIAWNVLTVTTLQTAVPEGMQARIFGAAKASVAVLVPVGALVAGAASNIIDLQLLYGVIAAYELTLAAFLLLLTNRVVTSTAT